VVRTVASVSFAAEVGGTVVRTTTSTAADGAAGTTTIDHTQYATDGTRLWETRAATVLTTATGNSVRTLSFDDTGDGIFDRTQTTLNRPASALNDNQPYAQAAEMQRIRQDEIAPEPIVRQCAKTSAGGNGILSPFSGGRKRDYTLRIGTPCEVD
jgi:hypothetical protein